MVNKDLQIAWAAGLFEGEGCITDLNSPNNPLLQMTMTDKDVMEKFVSIVGYGKLTLVNKGAYYQKPHWKDQYKWAIRKKSEVERILQMFLPYFGERRAYMALNTFDKIHHI